MLKTFMTLCPVVPVFAFWAVLSCVIIEILLLIMAIDYHRQVFTGVTLEFPTV